MRSDSTRPQGSRGHVEAKRTLPRELSTDPVEPRRFEAPDGSWLAYLAGRSVGGTGSYNLALLEAVHFARAEQPDVPLCEALLGRGGLVRLTEAELIGVLRRAKPLEPSRD